jgi:hypothetical protein
VVVVAGRVLVVGGIVVVTTLVVVVVDGAAITVVVGESVAAVHTKNDAEPTMAPPTNTTRIVNMRVDTGRVRLKRGPLYAGEATVTGSG